MKREERRHATRRALADAALALFLERGVDDVTIEEIASAAGVSPRTFFLHFPSKAAAVFPDHEDNVADLTNALAALPAHGDDVAQVCDLVVAGVRRLSASPFRQGRFALVRRWPAIRDVDARTDRDYEDAVAAHLRSRWGEGAPEALQAAVVANVVIGVARAALALWAQDGLDAAERTRAMLDRFLLPPLSRPPGMFVPGRPRPPRQR